MRGKAPELRSPALWTLHFLAIHAIGRAAKPQWPRVFNRCRQKFAGPGECLRSVEQGIDTDDVLERLQTTCRLLSARRQTQCADYVERLRTDSHRDSDRGTGE